MIQAFIMRIIQSVEMIQSKGWTALVKELFYIKREAILLEKDLSEVNEDRSYLEKENLKFVELTSQTIKQYEYTLKSRYHKAVLYCKKGYQGFAIIRENRIIGDTWYYTSRLSNKPIDIGWLGWNDCRFATGCDAVIACRPGAIPERSPSLGQAGLPGR